MLRAAGLAVVVLMCAIVLAIVLTWRLQLHGLAAFAFVVLGAPSFAFGIGWLAFRFGSAVGDGWKAIAVDGTSTPYREQFSYQQALVMQGRLAEALDSFEAIIAERPLAADARIRAAELYARDKHDARRAAELFR